MEIVFRRGTASASEVLADLPDPPSYSAVRALLRILEEKGHLTHRRDGSRYVYAPTRARGRVARGALKQLLATFFNNSAEQAVAALLDADPNLSKEQLDRLDALIQKAKKEGR